MATAVPASLTLAEFLQQPETKPASEYVEGRVFQKPMPQGKHSRLQLKVCQTVNSVAEAPRIALAFPELRCTFGGRSIVPDATVFLGNDPQTAIKPTQVGVISDTHGLLRPEAIAALQGSNLILHAGDIGKPEVLDGLKAIAPVIAVRGNNDTEDWAEAIPEQETIQVGAVSIHLLHIVQELNLNPQGEGIQVVISGHSHKPVISDRDGVLFLNPGSAGPRRFKLPISVAQLQIQGTSVQAKMIELEV